MADQLAEQKTLSDVLHQLQLANNNFTPGQQVAEKQVEVTEKQTDAVKDTKDAVKDGSDIVSGAVTKASELSKSTAQILQKAQMGVWNGIKASLGFTGKTLSGMARITGLQWALAKREGKASRLMEFAKAGIKPIASAFKSGISTLMDFLTTLGKLGLFLAAGGLLELFTNEKWQEWLKNMWNTMVEKIKTWWKETDFKALFEEYKEKLETWIKDTAKPALKEAVQKLKDWWETSDLKKLFHTLIFQFKLWWISLKLWYDQTLAPKIKGMDKMVR